MTEQLPESSKSVRCKLCAAFVASQMPSIAEMDFHGSETFSRDPEICDACLAHDYSARGPISTEWWIAGNLGGGFAIVVFVVLGYLGRHNGFVHPVPLRRFEPMLVKIGIAILSGACFSIVAGLLLGLWIGRWSRSPETSESAQRYRWLARWAELTGHEEFRKKMLRKAAALDPSRGIDPPVGGL